MVAWFTQRKYGGFPIERVAFGDCDLSVLHVSGEWQWLIRRDDRRRAGSPSRGGARDRRLREIDDRVVEAPQRAVMTDADDRRPPGRFAQQAI